MRNYVQSLARPALFCTLFLLSILTAGNALCGVAQYEVTFEATWSADTHPDAFPPNPHFSGLVGGTHNADVSFWDVGELATLGIQRMAEWGSTTPLDEEVAAAVTAGTAESVLLGPGIGVSPGTAGMTFNLSEAYSRVTLVSMIAPSPDWFIGVSGLDLRSGDAWVAEIVVTLWPYDAGTDSGASYGSPNQPTVPHQPISQITELPVGNGVAMGTLTFTFLGESTDVPRLAGFALDNAPNPFNPTTEIRFTLPRKDHVRLDVFDLAGRRIATLLDAERGDGQHSLTFTPDDLGSGIYLYALQTSAGTVKRKMTLLK